jgi:hypothetical protein
MAELEGRKASLPQIAPNAQAQNVRHDEVVEYTAMPKREAMAPFRRHA